jgi:hypothetical protein
MKIHFVINLMIFIWYYKYLYFLFIISQIWYNKIWYCSRILFLWTEDVLLLDGVVIRQRHVRAGRWLADAQPSNYSTSILVKKKKTTPRAQQYLCARRLFQGRSRCAPPWLVDFVYSLRAASNAASAKASAQRARTCLVIHLVSAESEGLNSWIHI